MTESLISLVSIVFGILGANALGIAFKTYSFEFTGNTLIGVFGSVLTLKVVGRVGFDPISIMRGEETDWLLFIVNIFVAFISGALSVYFAKIIKMKLDSRESVGVSDISIFKFVSFLEGVSYVLLLFIAVPIKYLAENAMFVKWLGMPHGILFILYIILALWIRSKMKWTPMITVIVLVASLLPFGTFYVNKKYL